MTYLFWASLFGVTFSYFLYPLTLMTLLLWPRRRPAPAAGDKLPELTLIIAARNEEARIVDKLRNVLDMDYPRDRLQIIVVSDASDDHTDDLVRGLSRKGVRLIRANARGGKEAAQQLAIAEARGEILVFSDVATRFDGEALRNMAARFADPKIGAVSSEDRLLRADGRIAGEGAYVKYEMALRRLESKVGSLVGLSGSFFAARAVVCEQWDTRIPSDFNVALRCARMGYRAVSDPTVIGCYADIADDSKEYARKLRTVVRGMAALWVHLGVFNPLRYGLFSYQVCGHKLFRWLVPWCMPPLLAASVMLACSHWVYAAALCGQVVFYLLAAGGFASATLRRFTLFKIPYFFVQVNLAIAHATIQFLSGRRIVTWTPSSR